MMTLGEFVAACRMRQVEVRRWVEAGWLLPTEVDGDWQFGEVDVARARLIRELRRDFGVNAEAIPLILDLIDQRIRMECRLRRVLESLAGQPEALRAEVLARLLRD